MRYRIMGEPLPVVICDLEPNETMISESGAMGWMSPNMHMETSTNGGIGKAFGRVFAGDSMFQNRYTAMNAPGQIAFTSSFPGSIRAIEITPDRDYIVQKKSFLASGAGVNLSVHLNKKLSSGIFGGEGFIMQKLSGQGTAFIEIDGHACEYELKVGESMIVSTGYLAYMEATCTMEIIKVPGIKNMFLGGEGFFNTKVNGPGKVVLQTMPIMAVANSLNPYIVASK